MIGIKKRFQVAKCKTSLKLATARIKLMRNKKGAQVIQMKKELAQLLAAGDDRTARVRVEHVIREEKMIGAYDLIEIYCELIVARLPIIESQKTCPMDLKEAIASVIFATPRCSDITELVDVKKNFRAKYGKEFVTAATELIPGCGVNNMLVEKLSAVAPNIQTKVKVLSGIAKEHNIDWEATSFEESKPRDDLLATPITVDPPKVQTQDVPADFFQLNKRFTSDAKNNVTPADTSSQQSSHASTSHNDARPAGMESGSMKKNQSPNSSDNGDMEFKDAKSAAHAAAEAAERASYAARAAAQLARQGSLTQQNPTKSHESHIRDENTSSPKVTKSSSGSRSRNDSDEGSADYDDHQEDRYHKTHKDPGSSPRKSSKKEPEARSKIQNQKVRHNENNSSPKVTKSSSGSRSKNDSDEDSVTYDNHHEDRYSRTHEDHGPYPRKSSKKETEARLKIQNQNVRQNENNSSPKVTKSSSGSRSRNDSDVGSVTYDNYMEDRYSRTHEDHGPYPQKSSKKETEARLKIQNQNVRQNENNSSPKVTKSSSGSRLRNDSDEGSVTYDNHQEDRYSRTHEDHGPYPRKSSKKETEARLKIQNQNARQNENNSSPKVTKSSSGSRSRNDSDEGSVDYDNHQEDRYPKTHKDHGSSHQKSSKKKTEARFKRGDSRYDKAGYDDDDQGSSSPEISSRQKSKKTSSFSDAHRDDESKSKTKKTSGEHDELTSKSKKVGRKEPVVRKTEKTSSFSDAHRDDESESDDDYDGPRFDAEFDHLEDAAKSFFPSPDKEEDSHVWSPTKNISNTKDRVKPAKSVDYSVKSNLSDGPESESETETVKSGFSRSYKFDSQRKHDYSRNSRTELDDLMQRSSSYHKQSGVSDTEEDSRYGTLAGSHRNKGNQKPHTKITSPSKKPVEESQSPVKVNQASSFNSRPSRVVKKKPSIYKTSSESDRDDNDDKFPEKPSRSPFARPNTFFSYGNDSDEEVSPPKHTPPSKANLGPNGVSRRTKGQVEPKAKQSRAEPAEDLKKHPTSTISPPKPRPHASRPKQEPPKRIPEPKVSKPEVSTPPVEVDNVKKPSHVHPKLPEFETLADRIYAINKMERQ